MTSPLRDINDRCAHDRSHSSLSRFGGEVIRH